MNVPLDLYIILKWLGFEKHSFYQFKNHYCQMGGFGGYEIVMEAYKQALKAGFKVGCFGDVMLIVND